MLASLTRVRIAALVSLTTVAGWVLGAGALSRGLLWCVVGTFLLAAGASALNQVQERRQDALMQRTRGRPIPSGRISVAAALGVSFSLLAAGGAFLTWAGGLAALGLGAFALLWYNGVYTHLKRRTRFAAVPGALIGAVPPAIGCVAAGGDLGAPPMLAVMFFMFIWQVPHFWLLLLLYPRDYERAGWRDLQSLFSPPQLSRVTAVWTFAAATAALLFPLFGAVRLWPTVAVLVAAATWLCAGAAGLLCGTGDGPRVRRVFAQINLFALVALLGLIVDQGV